MHHGNPKNKQANQYPSPSSSIDYRLILSSLTIDGHYGELITKVVINVPKASSKVPGILVRI